MNSSIDAISTSTTTPTDMVTTTHESGTAYSLAVIAEGSRNVPITPSHPRNHDIEQAGYISRWSHKPDIVYLDHGAFGGCPIDVMEAQSEIRRNIESDPHDFFERKFPSALFESKKALARFLNCDVTGLVLVPGATHAMNIIIHSQTFQPGDEIITTNHAYSSVKMALDVVAQRDDAKVVIADIPFPIESDEQIIECIFSKVTNKTRFAVIDHLPSRSAIIFPIKKIVTMMEERGIEILVDGAHAPGMIELDISSINAPYYVANCHKWMCSPRGIGFIHVRHDRYDHVRPLVVARSPHMVDKAKFSTLQHKFDWLGTCDPSAYLTIPAVIRFLETVVPGGYSALLRKNRTIAIAARKLICEKLNIPIPCPEHMIGSMATMPFPDSVGPAGEGMLPLQKTLWQKYRVELPVYAWPSHPRRVFRISVQAFNFFEQYSWLADVLRSIPECMHIERPRGPPQPPSSPNHASGSDGSDGSENPPSNNGNNHSNANSNTDNSGNNSSNNHSTSRASKGNSTATNLEPTEQNCRPDFKQALISQGCVDPYVCDAVSKNSNGHTKECMPHPKYAEAELADPTIDDLQILSLLRVVSVVKVLEGERKVPPPPLVFPTASRDYGKSLGADGWSAFHNLECENSRMTYTLSNFRERGIPTRCASLIQEALDNESVLEKWVKIVAELGRRSQEVGQSILAQHTWPSQSCSDGQALEKSSFGCKIIPYATHAGPSNIGLSLWERALGEVARNVENGILDYVEQFLQIHAFLKDPIGGLRGSFNHQLAVFKGLLLNFQSDMTSLGKFSFSTWKAVIAQMAVESSFLAIPKLKKVAHIHFVGHQQLTYIYVTLSNLRRAEFSLPKRVLQLAREMLDAAARRGRHFTIAPITVTYCHSLQSSSSAPFSAIIDGNNRVTALVLLRFLAGLPPSTIPTPAALATHCRAFKLCAKWLSDVTDALNAACPTTLTSLLACPITLARFKYVSQIPALLTQEPNFHTVWVGNNPGNGSVTLLQPVQQAVFAELGMRIAIPAKQQSHGRSLGFKALPVKCVGSESW